MVGVPGVVTGTADVPVSAVLTDLTPNTTYHYRAVGASDGGTAYGADEAFTTDPVPPTAVTEAGATFTGPTSAIVYGTVTAHYADTAVAFHYGPDTGYGEVAAADPGTVTGDGATGVSALLTGLVPGETTHYRVVAESIGGRVEGVDRILVVPPAPPLAVTGEAEDVTPTGATMHGTVNARNDQTTVWFEYGLSTLYISGIAATPNSVSGLSDVLVSAGVSGLLPNTTYHYQVVAENSAGCTEGGDRVFTTAKIPPAFLSLGVTSGERDAAIRHRRIDRLLQARAAPHHREAVVRLELGPDAKRRRKHAHAAGGEGGHEGMVLELACNPWTKPVALEPLLQWQPEGRLGRGQQDRHPVERGREVGRHLGREFRRGEPADRREVHPVAEQSQARIGRSRTIREHQVEPVQRHFAQQLVEIALVGHQAQLGRGEQRPHEFAHHQLGQAVRHPDREAQRRSDRGVANPAGQLLPELEDLVGLAARRLAGVGQGQAPAGRAQERMAELALQRAHLGTERLHRDAEAGRRAGHAALAGDNPEVVQVAIAEAEAH